MKVEKIFPVYRLREAVKEGLVSERWHPTLPLRIFNYTPEAQIGLRWDQVTENCRGLILDADDNVVARPFKKFFNADTSYRPETAMKYLAGRGTPYIQEKLDGSLGILYSYMGEFGIATRGSFESDQAKWATEWLKKRVFDARAIAPKGMTALFEIIYSENMVVVEYDYEGLVFLGYVVNKNGSEIPPTNARESCRFMKGIGIREPKVFDKTIEECKSDNRANEEGYVLSWFYPDKPAFKVKVKFEEYEAIHKLIAGVSPKKIWMRMSQGQTKDQILEEFSYAPDRFVEWLNAVYTDIMRRYYDIGSEAVGIYDKSIRHFGFKKPRRADFANFILEPGWKKYKAILFRMFDDEPYSDIIYKMVKPKGEDKVYVHDN